MSGLGRIITAMVTPMDSRGEVDFARARELARRLLDNGSDALLVSGTTGESPTLTTSEKLRLFSEIKGVMGEHPLIAGAGSNNTRGSIEFARQALDAGADAILAVVPYYNKPPQEGMYRHFEALAGSVDAPVVLYNIPGRTGKEMLPETIARLAQIPNIVAVKESLPSLDPVSALAYRLRGLSVERGRYSKWVASPLGFDIYSGDDSSTLPMLSLGAVGVISVASHVAGPQMQQMLEAWYQGNTAVAADWHYRLLPLFNGLFATTNPILPKAALALQNFSVGGLRLPLIEATPAEVEALRAIMYALHLL